MKENNKSIIIDIPKYNGAAIYALVDQNNKRYVGSTNHLNRRIKTHRCFMNMVLTKGENGFVNPKLTTAIKNGSIFMCEVLAYIKTELSKNEAEEIERVFIQHFGGIENTYNVFPIKNKV